jgi:hypothetical protein
MSSSFTSFIESMDVIHWIHWILVILHLLKVLMVSIGNISPVNTNHSRNNLSSRLESFETDHYSWVGFDKMTIICGLRQYTGDGSPQFHIGGMNISVWGNMAAIRAIANKERQMR